MGYKISVWIVLFLLFFNGGHVLMAESGAYSYLGVSANPGDHSQLDKGEEKLKKFSTPGGGDSTLFALYNTVANPLEIMFNAIMPGAAMLKNIGWPKYIVNFLFSGLAVIPGIDLVKFLRSG